MLNEGDVSDRGLPAVLFLFKGLFIHYRALPESGKGFSRGFRGPWEGGHPCRWGRWHAKRGAGWLRQQGGPYGARE